MQNSAEPSPLKLMHVLSRKRRFSSTWQLNAAIMEGGSVIEGAKSIVGGKNHIEERIVSRKSAGGKQGSGEI